MPIQPLAIAQAHLDELIEAVVTTNEHVTITRDGTPVAVLVPYEEWERVMDTLQIITEPETLRDLADAETDRAGGRLLDVDQ